MNYFLVFQNQSYKEERNSEYLWAPKRNKAGQTFHHWTDMQKIKKGDIIFNSYKGKLVSVLIAKEDCKEHERPPGLDQLNLWEKNGWLVNANYKDLEKPITYKDYMEDILKLQDGKYAPFNKLGRGNTGYLFQVPTELADFLFKIIERTNGISSQRFESEVDITEEVINQNDKNLDTGINLSKTEKESYSWSKPKTILNLIGRKHVDWSIFENGSTIPSEFYEDFDEVNGVLLKRGERRELKIIYKGKIYKAIFINLNRKNNGSNAYQIRYDSNKELKDLLIEVFAFSYRFLNAARKKAQLEGKKKVYALVPSEKGEFIDFFSTGRPFEYEITFHPYIEKNLYDDNYQEEIEVSLKNKIVSYEDVPKSKPSKTLSNINSYKRDKFVGRNAIITANFHCEVDNNHKDFISKITGENYVEAHHLVPIEFQDNFDVSIDVEANVVSLCVSCHKKLHHANFDEKQETLKLLFEKRYKRLERSGVLVNQDILYEFYR